MRKREKKRGRGMGEKNRESEREVVCRRKNNKCDRAIPAIETVLAMYPLLKGTSSCSNQILEIIINDHNFT